VPRSVHGAAMHRGVACDALFVSFPDWTPGSALDTYPGFAGVTTGTGWSFHKSPALGVWVHSAWGQRAGTVNPCFEQMAPDLGEAISPCAEQLPRKGSPRLLFKSRIRIGSSLHVPQYIPGFLTSAYRRRLFMLKFNAFSGIRTRYPKWFTGLWVC